MTITHKLKLDLQHKGEMPRIDGVQGDAFTRQVDLVLENGYEFQPMGDGWYGKGGMRGQLLAFHPRQGRAFACHAYELKDMTPYRAALLAGKLG